MDKKAASSSRDESCQPIIPGLPDDLALRCLARLSHGYHGLLELVCKTWRDSIRSLGYARVKAQEGWSGNWLFVFTEEQIFDQWIAYDPEADRWHLLPPIPFANSASEFACVCVAKKLLLIGGVYYSYETGGRLKGATITSDVIKFDPFSNQWSRVASMRVARTNFACAVVHGKVYVAGGRKPSCSRPLRDAEVYDPVEDSWQDIPPLLDACQKPYGFSHGGLFYVAYGMHVQIFDPVKSSWYSQRNFLPFSSLRRCPAATTVKECIYMIDGWKGADVYYWDPKSGRWIIIGSVPFVHFPASFQAFGFGVIGFQNEMYFIGGNFYKRDDQGKRVEVDIEQLNSIRVCKVSGEQLEWREVRPIRGIPGKILRLAVREVVGCAVLEE